MQVCIFMCVFTSLEIQQEPAVAEVEVSVITILLHQFKQLRVQYLTSDESHRLQELVYTEFSCRHMQRDTLGHGNSPGSGTSCWQNVCPWHHHLESSDSSFSLAE